MVVVVWSDDNTLQLEATTLCQNSNSCFQFVIHALSILCF